MNNFKIEELRNVIIQMKIPVSFDVLNSFTIDDEGKPYLMQIDGIPAKIHFKRIYDFKYKSDLELAPYSKIDEDRSSMLSHMQVQVWFDNKMINSDKIDKEVITINPDQFVDITIEYLNKFINIYRNVSNQFWVRRIVRKDIFNYQYILVDSESNQQIVTVLIPRFHTVILNGDKDFKLEDSQDEKLRQLRWPNVHGHKIP